MKALIALFAMTFGGLMGVQDPVPGAPLVTDCVKYGCKPYVIFTSIGGCAIAPFLTDGTVKTSGKCKCVQLEETGPEVCIPDPDNLSYGLICSIIGPITVSNPAAAVGGFGGPGTCVCVGGLGVDPGMNIPVNVTLQTTLDCPGAQEQLVFDVKAGPCTPMPPPLANRCPPGGVACRLVVTLICTNCVFSC